MLIGIPKLISAELLNVLMKMGHGDEIVIADGNFPADSIARSTVHGKPVELSAAGLIDTVEAILRLFPLDAASSQPIAHMASYEGMEEQPIHAALRELCAKAGAGAEKIEAIPRFAFYDRAKAAYAVVSTSETARFANVILKKGGVKFTE